MFQLVDGVVPDEGYLYVRALDSPPRRMPEKSCLSQLFGSFSDILRPQSVIIFFSDLQNQLMNAVVCRSVPLDLPI